MIRSRAARAPNSLPDRAKLRSCERPEARRGRILDVFDRGATKGRDANPRFRDGRQTVRCSRACRKVLGCTRARAADRGLRGNGRERVRGRCAGSGKRAAHRTLGSPTPPATRWSLPRTLADLTRARLRNLTAHKKAAPSRTKASPDVPLLVCPRSQSQPERRRCDAEPASVAMASAPALALPASARDELSPPSGLPLAPPDPPPTMLPVLPEARLLVPPVPPSPPALPPLPPGLLLMMVPVAPPSPPVLAMLPAVPPRPPVPPKLWRC